MTSLLLQGAPLPPDFPGIPAEAVEITKFFFVTIIVIALGIPIIRALSRRFLERPQPPVALPPEVAKRLERIEQAVDSIAIEVERVAEGQRYTTRLMTEVRGVLPPSDPRTPG